MSLSEKVIMMCYIVLLSLFVTVSSAQHRSQNDYNNRNQDDEWVWGYAVVTEPNNIPAIPDRTNDKIKDPCTPYDPPKPNFSAPGRRICEIKCYEYIWELNSRHERNLRSEECNSMREWDSSDPNNIPPLGAIGGRITEPGEFPHMGAIGWQASTGTWVFKCGSSLISSKFVLTAGHCSRASDRDTTIADPVPKIVRLGDKNIIDVYSNGVPPTDSKIINIIVHPMYHPPKKYYDIALMELEDHVEFSKYVQPACLWTRFNTSSLSTEATLTGWGVVETIGRTTSPELQAAVVDLIDTTVCDQLLKPSCNRNWCGVRDTQICAGKLAGGVDACQQSEEWVWGYAVPVPTVPAHNPTVTHERITELCSPYNPPMPNFGAPGRRICERKCYEYIWELQTRNKRKLRSLECSLELNTQFIIDGTIGGRETEPGDFPHMGAIGWQASTGTWVFKCGSSLISSKFVLTAGHCSRASERDTTIADPVPKIIRLGDKNIIDVYTNGVLPTDAKIINIIVHPKFRPPKKYYDIALMELEDHVAFSKYVQPACLWTRFNTVSLGTEATLTGWGVVETIGRTTSPELQAAVVDFIDTTVCDKLLMPSCNRNWCGVRDNQICAGKLAGGVDACQGDSGGPLQVQIPLPITTEGKMHYIVGVTSFGIGCALPNLPGIYSRVSMYLDWIESIVWPM